MRPRRLAVVAMPIVVLAASQAGHLLALELKQGPRGLGAPGAGTHAYVPALSSLAMGAAGALVLVALLVVAWAGVAPAGHRPAAERQRRRPLVDLAAALFVAQLAIFLLQETVETAIAGQAPRGVGDLLLWGCLGQLPAALVAALALSWLGARVEAAVVVLAAWAGRPLVVRTVAPPARLRFPARPAARPAPVAGSVCQRGPPARSSSPPIAG
jgi:hypothetical protein